MEVYLKYARSLGKSAEEAMAKFPSFSKKRSYKAWLARERERQGLEQNRDIGDDVYNACTQMFLELPRPGNTYRTLWRLVFRAAKDAGLRENLDVDSVSASTLKFIANLVDRVFANGSLLRYIEKSGRKKLVFSVQNHKDPTEPDAAMYLDSRDNRMAFVRPTWRRRVPKNASMDGVRVANKLEWLCRMVAHELCHSLANVACGKGCRERARNHGPVFERLNHSIFGHPGGRKKQSLL